MAKPAESARQARLGRPGTSGWPTSAGRAGSPRHARQVRHAHPGRSGRLTPARPAGSAGSPRHVRHAWFHLPGPANRASSVSPTGQATIPPADMPRSHRQDMPRQPNRAGSGPSGAVRPRRATARPHPTRRTRLAVTSSLTGHPAVAPPAPDPPRSPPAPRSRPPPSHQRHLRSGSPPPPLSRPTCAVVARRRGCPSRCHAPPKNVEPSPVVGLRRNRLASNLGRHLRKRTGAHPCRRYWDGCIPDRGCRYGRV